MRLVCSALYMTSHSLFVNINAQPINVVAPAPITSPGAKSYEKNCGRVWLVRLPHLGEWGSEGGDLTILVADCPTPCQADLRLKSCLSRAVAMKFCVVR